MIDASLVQRLIDTHGAALQLFARQWCTAPEDAVQEAFVELLRQPSGPDDPLAWLYTVVRRRAMNIARAEQRRRRYQREAALERSPWFVPDESEPLSAEAYQTALQRLPSSQREIVVLRIWGNRTFAQIALTVELPLSTVHRHYRAALRALESVLSTPPSLSSANRSEEP
ncbi:RNA polymerase sigma factor [Roseimaritima sediminicola]|uniref:RNA polymerase sigma factor n=1 Tax=Roseimaritima sediminicola TaxID=2662066 RepID=UPI00138680DB|nr:sigma-70 family RNA polymerase sigma factor [Roseimaritima sediminicola]